MNDEELYELGVKVHVKVKPGPDRFLPSHPAVYGVGWPDGTTYDPMYYSCHGFFYNMKGRHRRDNNKPIPENPIVIAHRVYGYNKKQGDFFYHYLFNESPWADVFVTKDVSKVKTDGIIVRLDRPATLAISGAIATRHPWEKARLVDTFYNLVHAGLDKDMAMITACCVRWDGTADDYTSEYVNHHVCLYAYNMTKGGLKNFFNRHLPQANMWNQNTYQNIMEYSNIIGMWNERGQQGATDVLQSKFRGNSNTTQTNDPFGLLPKVAKQKPKSVVKEIEKIFAEVLA